MPRKTVSLNRMLHFALAPTNGQRWTYHQRDLFSPHAIDVYVFSGNEREESAKRGIPKD